MTSQREGALPNFLIVGAPKCGTSALHQYLGQHPAFCVSEPKETNYFTREYHRGLAWYEARFAHGAGRPFVGEASPSYVYLPWIIPRIQRHLGNPKIVILLREPAERAFSNWWMRWAMGFDDRSFEQAIDETLRTDFAGRIAGDDGPRIILDRHEHNGPYIFPYAKTVDRWKEAFPGNVGVFFSEDLWRDPASTVRRVIAFLGGDGDGFTPTGRDANPSAGIWGARAVRLMRRVGVDEPHKMTRVWALGRRPRLPPEMARRIRAACADDVVALERSLDVDLSRWKAA